MYSRQFKTILCDDDDGDYDVNDGEDGDYTDDDVTYDDDGK